MRGRSCSFRDWHDDYVVTTELALPSGFEPIEFHEPGPARAFLARVCAGDSGVLTSLRRIAAGECGPAHLGREDRTELLERVAGELVHGTLRVFRKVRPLRGARASPRELPDVPPSNLDSAPSHFFRVRLVDDASGAPIVGCRLELAVSSGTKRALVTNRDGIAEALDVPEGEYELGSPFGANTVDLTLVIADGEGGSGAETAEGPQLATAGTAWTIAQVKQHKVKKGDTLSSIAQANGISPVQLAYFNFGVYEGPEVEEALRNELGCTHQNKDGKYVFDDSDDPGIVYLPSRWSRPGLQTDVQHVIRVRPVDRKLPDLKFWLEIDVHSESAKDDKIILETEDGTWRQEHALTSLKEPEPGYVEAIFTSAPVKRRFHLVQDYNDGGPEHVLFEAFSYGDIRETAAGQVEDEEQFRDAQGAEE